MFTRAAHAAVTIVTNNSVLYLELYDAVSAARMSHNCPMCDSFTAPTFELQSFKLTKLQSDLQPRLMSPYLSHLLCFQEALTTQPQETPIDLTPALLETSPHLQLLSIQVLYHLMVQCQVCCC